MTEWFGWNSNSLLRVACRQMANHSETLYNWIVLILSFFVDYLLFGNRQFLVKMNRDGSGIQAFRLSQQNNVIAVDFDIR